MSKRCIRAVGLANGISLSEGQIRLLGALMMWHEMLFQVRAPEVVRAQGVRSLIAVWCSDSMNECGMLDAVVFDLIICVTG